MGIRPQPRTDGNALSTSGRVFVIFALLFFFLVGVKGLGDGFKMLGHDVLDVFFSATANPFLALIVGIFATTLVQSSSVSTSMIVALVAASENPLPLENAVPMIMGANIGTTVTNTVVSLGHMGRPDEFRRAFAAATVHDFFNYLAVVVLLPIELASGFLQSLAAGLASLLGDLGGVRFESPIRGVLKTAIRPVRWLAEMASDSPVVQGSILAAVSGLIIFCALFLLVRAMRAVAQSRIERLMGGLLGSNAIVAIIVGIIATVSVQSSSITTSLLVPLAGAGVITLQQAFPVTVGANIGTTVTALFAAMAVSGPNATAGVQIALIHLFFNLAATVMIYPIPAIRRLPMAAAQRFATAAVRSRKLALAYIAGLFYAVPAVLIIIHRALTSP